VATDEGGASYNVNADTMAGAIAAALKADTLLLLTDVAGVLDSDKTLLPSLTAAEAQALCDDGTASGPGPAIMPNAWISYQADGWSACV
ncbi:MAG: hypothetical protein SGPRY_005715, partial [Prymnesium sp.]